MKNVDNFEYFGFKKAIVNDNVVIYETLKNGKTHKVINFDKNSNVYRFSGDITKGKDKFDETTKRFTPKQLIYELIEDKIYDMCNHFDIDDLDIMAKMGSELNYHRTQELMNRIK